jgi:hypothetical protein
VVSIGMFSHAVRTAACGRAGFGWLTKRLNT